ncbi:hypothetical protein KG089_05365 [Carnobacteriaceae bacterium zg-ZUI252]|nr:hypothetical protein [Carnobacteriaceae bacterium zg-ZUI252]
MELFLTDKEAERLIKMLKKAVEKYNIIIKLGDTGTLTFCGLGGEKNGIFKMHYKFTKNNKVFHFMECQYNYTLFRVNLNNAFHKNADGSKVFGNRINIFSEKEFYEKQDGHTHYKAFSLPYDTINNTDDFLDMFEQLITFASIIKNEDLTISTQGDLF